jgi:transposase
MADLSIDLRRRLVEAYRSKKSGTYAGTARLFGVGEATVSRLLRWYRETGDVKYKPKGGNNPRRVDLDWLRENLQRHPDARLVDRISAWKEHSGKKVSLGTMWLSVRDCGWSHKKKTLVARERDRADVQAKRETFIVAQPLLDVTKLVFLDESGFRLGSPPHYGWAPVGKKSPGKSTQGDWCTMTMIGAVALDGWRSLITIDAATDGDVFTAYVQQQLVPQLRPGDIVVMDNLSAHKNKIAIAAIHAANAEVLFLPPYSPEFNPIEKVWAKLKEILRRLPTLTRDVFDDAVAFSMDCISTQDIAAWTQFSGYSIAST